MSTAACPARESVFWSPLPFERIAITRAQARAAALTIALMFAPAFRTAGLSTYGFSVDEINKVDAITHYRAGDFTANAEHPMLMKLAMRGSVETMGVWNRIAPPGQHMSLETAIRLPNALAGAATTVVMFGVADLLFGGAVATRRSASGFASSVTMPRSASRFST